MMTSATPASAVDTRIGPGRPVPSLGMVAIVFVLILWSAVDPVRAGETWTGRGIMTAVSTRHNLFPHVYEEQTMILMDGSGNRDVRKLRRYSRIEKSGTVRFLLVFYRPVEVSGVALLAEQRPDSDSQSSVYLPALGQRLISPAGNGRSPHFLGTDFTVEDLTPEVVTDYRYRRAADQKIGQRICFVVEAVPTNTSIERQTGYSLRRHFVRKDNFFIVRTDYYDLRGRFSKTRTCYDIKPVDRQMWRANMTLMQDHKRRHKTLIKVDRRVFSRDYVPAGIFSADWILSHRHMRPFRPALSLNGLGQPETGQEHLP